MKKKLLFTIPALALALAFPLLACDTNGENSSNGVHNGSPEITDTDTSNNTVIVNTDTGNTDKPGDSENEETKKPDKPGESENEETV